MDLWVSPPFHQSQHYWSSLLRTLLLSPWHHSIPWRFWSQYTRFHPYWIFSSWPCDASDILRAVSQPERPDPTSACLHTARNHCCSSSCEAGPEKAKIWQSLSWHDLTCWPGLLHCQGREIRFNSAIWSVYALPSWWNFAIRWFKTDPASLKIRCYPFKLSNKYMNLHLILHHKARSFAGLSWAPQQRHIYKKRVIFWI